MMKSGSLSRIQAWSTRNGTGTCTSSSNVYSVLNCTQYFAKIMSTSTRTYWSGPVLMSTTEYFFYFETVL